MYSTFFNFFFFFSAAAWTADKPTKKHGQSQLVKSKLIYRGYLMDFEITQLTEVHLLFISRWNSLSGENTTSRPYWAWIFRYEFKVSHEETLFPLGCMQCDVFERKRVYFSLKNNTGAGTSQTLKCLIISLYKERFVCRIELCFY